MTRTIATIFSAILIIFILSGCNELATDNTNATVAETTNKTVGENSSSSVENVALVEIESETAGEEQWEYLIVSFGKTAFGDIESNIASGESKLAAFQEFSRLLAGHEALGLQKKMDILGRFGWEAVDVVGVIGGDQQLMFKRQRRDNRIEAEQRVIAKLSSILREETAAKEAQLKAIMDELQSTQEKTKDELVDLDLKEKREREAKERDRLQIALKSIIDASGAKLQNGVSVKSVEYDIWGEEIDKRKTLMKGSITVILDGTVFLKKGNTYRESVAEQAAEDFVSLFKRQQGVLKEQESGKFVGSKYYHCENLRLYVLMQIQHDDREHNVASTSLSFILKGFTFEKGLSLKGGDKK